MPRFLIRPVFWKDPQGRLRRLSLLLDRTEVVGPLVFAFRPYGCSSLGAWLLDHGASPLDVEVDLPRLIPQEEGERLAKLAL